MNEESAIWKPVTESPNYSVSSDGQVRSERTGRILTPRFNHKGYLQIMLYPLASKPINRKVHRLVAREFCEGYAQDLTVNHKNGKKTDNRAENLEWVTAEANIEHAFQTGLGEIGERNRQAKLTDAAADFIRQSKGKSSAQALAKAFGVNAWTVNAIWTGEIRKRQAI